MQKIISTYWKNCYLIIILRHFFYISFFGQLIEKYSLILCSIGSLGADNSEAEVSNVVVNRAALSGTTNGVRIKTWQVKVGLWILKISLLGTLQL